MSKGSLEPKQNKTVYHAVSATMSDCFNKSRQSFAQFFTSEICQIPWRHFASLILWTSNETVANSSFILDWRSHCVLQEYFSPAKTHSRERLRSIRAPNWDSDAIDDSSSSALNVSRADIARCTFA